MKRVLLLIPFLLAGCGIAQSAPAAPQNATIMLDWTINSDHGGLYTALRRGDFSRLGIHAMPRVPSASTAQIQLVASGRAGFGISYETDVLAARAQGIPIKSVMCIMQHPLNTVMTLKTSDISRPRDLAGKSVGMAGSPSDKPIVAAMMHADGSSIARTHMVNVGYNLLPALLAHKVDAVVGVYWTWEAIIARQHGDPVNVMRVERWGVPNYCELVLVASDHTIRTRPAYVRDIVHAMQQGYAYAAAHPIYAWNALHAASPSLGRSLVVQSLRLLGPIETDARTVGYQIPTQWSHYAAWLWSNHLISHRVNASSAFTNRFLAARVR